MVQVFHDLKILPSDVWQSDLSVGHDWCSIFVVSSIGTKISQNLLMVVSFSVYHLIWALSCTDLSPPSRWYPLTADHQPVPNQYTYSAMQHRPYWIDSVHGKPIGQNRYDVISQ